MRPLMVPILCCATLSAMTAVWVGYLTYRNEIESSRIDVDGRRSEAIAKIAESPSTELTPEAEAPHWQGAGVAVAASVVDEVDRVVEVEYDLALDRLKLRARNVSLATLLERLAAETGVEIVIIRKSLQLDETISIEFHGTLTRGFDVLLREFDTVVVFSPAPEPLAEDRVIRVLVAGRPEAIQQQAEPADATEFASERRRARPGRSDPAQATDFASQRMPADGSLGSDDLAVALFQAVDTGDAESAARIVDELIENGVETEKDRAFVALRRFVDLTTLPVEIVEPVEKIIEDRALNSSDPIIQEAAVVDLDSLVDAKNKRFLEQVAELQLALRVRYQ